MARLADEMHFVEHDLGRISDVPEAGRDRRENQHAHDDGVDS